MIVLVWRDYGTYLSRGEAINLHKKKENGKTIDGSGNWNECDEIMKWKFWCWVRSLEGVDTTVIAAINLKTWLNLTRGWGLDLLKNSVSTYVFMLK